MQRSDPWPAAPAAAASSTNGLAEHTDVTPRRSPRRLAARILSSAGRPEPRGVTGHTPPASSPAGRRPAMAASASLRVGCAATPPADRVDREPQTTPSARLRPTVHPESRPQRNPASKLSPAPTESRTSTTGASTCTRRQPSCARAPSAPSLTTGSGPRAARTVAATVGSVALETPAASAALTKRMSTIGSTSASPPCQRSAGSQLRSRDVVAPAACADSNRPRSPCARRGCR